jgi:macrolide-specific efflux system membrane fusion protein
MFATEQTMDAEMAVNRVHNYPNTACALFDTDCPASSLPCCASSKEEKIVMTQENVIPPLEADAKTAKWRLSRRTIMVLAGLVLLLAGAFLAWYFWLAPEDPADKLVTAVVQRGDIEDAITATGTLQPKNYVDVGTQVSGQLKRVLFEVGSSVKAKDLLAEIDPSVYQSKVDADQAQLLNQRSQLADKESQLVLAELQLTRQKNMMREDATTAEALQSAEAVQRSARAQVKALKAQMQQTQSTLRGDEANLGYTKIYAPISGTVVSQAAKEGQTLNANQQAPIVLRIADLSTMTVQAQVSEADVSKLRIGMEVYFTTLGGSSRRYYSTLRQIPPTPNVVNNVVLYDALFDVPNPNQTLMTQMTAQVFFVLASAKDAIYVPLTALHPLAEKGQGAERRRGGSKGTEGTDPRRQFADGRALVTVMQANGDLEEREVKVGVMTRVSAQILSGLAPGEKVVTGTQAVAKPAAPKTGGGMIPTQNIGGRH